MDTQPSGQTMTEAAGMKLVDTSATDVMEHDDMVSRGLD